MAIPLIPIVESTGQNFYFSSPPPLKDGETLRAVYVEDWSTVGKCRVEGYLPVEDRFYTRRPGWIASALMQGF